MANQLERMNQNVMTELLVKLETKLDADVFTYYGEIVNGVERHVKDIIETLSRDPQKHDKVYVVLTTPGGSLPPVQRMVDILRHFYSEVNFIVPDYAYSAGTIWCMSGNNIYMNYYSTLGPIDPQVQNKDGNLVAALGYLDKINELLEKAKDKKLTDAEFLILKDFASSRMLAMMASAFWFSIMQESTATTRWLFASYVPEIIFPFFKRANTACTLLRYS